MCRFKIKIMCFHLFYAEQVGTVIKKFFTTHACHAAQVRLHCVLLKKIISV